MLREWAGNEGGLLWSLSQKYPLFGASHQCAGGGGGDSLLVLPPLGREACYLLLAPGRRYGCRSC